MTDERIRTEELSISGERLVSTVKEIVRQGNVRRIAVRNRDGDTVFELSLTLGVVGVLLLPTLAALGAVAALLTECTIVIERLDDEL
jgi:Tfp pilus assembly protein PilN